VATENLRRFEALKGFLSCEPGEGEYAAVAAGLGMTSGAVSTAVHRLRDRYRELVRTEILRTVERPVDLDDELRCIIAALG
jgi:RNA polymerase sigma-70 factor (ECF subfamily)